jgi:CRP/FNR family transcriptional regulator
VDETRDTLTIVEKTVFLMEFELFKNMESEQVARIASLTKEKRLDEGECIFVENEPAEAAFLVVDGCVKITRKGKTLREVTRNGGFGLLEVVAPGHTYSVCAQAVERTHVLTFSREDVLYAVGEYPKFAIGLIRSMADSLIKHTGLRKTILDQEE